MKEIFSALALDSDYELSNPVQLPSCFAVSALASSVFGAVGLAMRDYLTQSGLSQSPAEINVDQNLASLWFAQSIEPIDWKMPPLWDAVAGDYQTEDGWIKLHTNLDHHRHAALSVLDCLAERDQVESAALKWQANELEQAIVNAGGVAAKFRSRDEWCAHPQGRSLAKEPLIHWGASRRFTTRSRPAQLQRPMSGLRVLDLTRVLAGPVASRTLAGFGAQVLRIDPPGWDEPYVVPDITLGKRCARLQLDQSEDRKIFDQLLSEADVLIHGYRPGALANLGYGHAHRRSLSENLIEVSLDAYGWTGPWAQRRGFDSLVQMSCGIAHTGMLEADQHKPRPLPVQALDHATGYLMAASTIKLLTQALSGYAPAHARLSLARTAELLLKYPQTAEASVQPSPARIHYSDQLETTPWGAAYRLKPALELSGTPMKWDRGACKLGSAQAVWH